MFDETWHGSEHYVLGQDILLSHRARNNGRSTDNVQTDLGVDRSTFCLAGHVDQSHLIVLKMK